MSVVKVLRNYSFHAGTGFLLNPFAQDRKAVDINRDSKSKNSD